MPFSQNVHGKLYFSPSYVSAVISSWFRMVCSFYNFWFILWYFIIFSQSAFSGSFCQKVFLHQIRSIPFNSYLVVSFSCKSKLDLNVRFTEAGDYLLNYAPINLWLQHSPGQPLSPRAFELFDFWRSNSPHPVPKNLFKCPTCKTRWMGKCPNPGPLFFVFYRSKQYAIFKVPELAFFILKLEKGIFYLHSPFGHERNC